MFLFCPSWPHTETVLPAQTLLPAPGLLLGQAFAEQSAPPCLGKTEWMFKREYREDRQRTHGETAERSQNSLPRGGQGSGALKDNSRQEYPKVPRRNSGPRGLNARVWRCEVPRPWYLSGAP